MRKYFSIAVLLLVCHLPALSQTYTEGRKMDSLRLDSMKRMLPLLKDSARVDLMNLIATEFGYFGPIGGFTYKKDSIHHYASKAYEEARKVGYKSGIAKSLLGLKTKDDTTKEKNIREAIKLAEVANNDNVLGWAYYKLAELGDIENYKKSIYHFQKAGDVLREAEVTNWLCASYSGKGEPEKAFEYCQRSETLSKKIMNLENEWAHFLVQFSLMSMSDLYRAVGDYQTALDYVRRGQQYGKEKKTDWGMENIMIDLFKEMGQYDSVSYYVNRYLQSNPDYAKMEPWPRVMLGQSLLLIKKYDLALKLFQMSMNSLRKRPNLFSHVLIRMAKAYAGKQNYAAALKYAKRGIKAAPDFMRNDKAFMLDNYELLSDIYHRLGKNDSAYRYLKQYTILKDSIQNKKQLHRLNIQLYQFKKAEEEARKEAQIGFLRRDNTIKQQQLEQEALMRKFLFAGLFALIVLGVIVFRFISFKRKNERQQLEHQLQVQQLEGQKKQIEFQQKASELEMQALRAQMNPHFIFNCLSSINWYILENDTGTASQYLTRFSRLIRMVLTNSEKSMITLEEEIKMLRLYLDMERVRFKDAFDYTITSINTIDSEIVFVPPLFLQPFCENAIWHGLMHKEGKGHLDIALSMEDGVLMCIITDNGIGREKAAELKSKSAKKNKSMGLKITTERLALFNQKKDIRAFYETEDMLDENGAVAGTRVILKIAYREIVEELA